MYSSKEIDIAIEKAKKEQEEKLKQQKEVEIRKRKEREEREEKIRKQEEVEARKRKEQEEREEKLKQQKEVEARKRKELEERKARERKDEDKKRGKIEKQKNEQINKHKKQVSYMLPVNMYRIMSKLDTLQNIGRQVLMILDTCGLISCISGFKTKALSVSISNYRVDITTVHYVH